jgi:hypothetical protein
MVKQQFTARYAPPKYTFGLGGSGGAIQQFIYEQNHPDLLDGLVPTHAYPDMIGQTTRVGDCELLEHYFDVTDNANPKWHSWDNRRQDPGPERDRRLRRQRAGTSSARASRPAPPPAPAPLSASKAGAA